MVLVSLSAATGVELWLFRGARAWFGVGPGEFLPLPLSALAAVILASPTGALVGAAFPLACCAGRSGSPGALEEDRTGMSLREGSRALGRVYALESLGSLIGGAVFTFWAVEHLNPVQTVMGCAALTLFASAGLLSALRRRSLGSAGLALIAGWLLVTAAMVGEGLNRSLVERRWREIAPEYELCAEAETKYQNLAVGRLAEQYTLYCDGQVSADFPDPYTFVPLAHFWMCQHPAPQNVLVLGGGAEGLLANVLQHPVVTVDYVEADDRLIELIDPYLAKQDHLALLDERVTVHHRDARHYVKTQRDRFDLVIARLPEPTSAMRARLLSDEFFGELRRAMTPRSVLCLTVAAGPGQLFAVSAEYLAMVRMSLGRHFDQVTVSWGNPAHIFAATGPGLVTTDPRELSRRYGERAVRSELFDPAWFDGAVDWLDERKVAQRRAELDAVGDIEVSTDLRPLIFLKRLALWEQVASGGTEGVIAGLCSVSWRWLLVALGFAGILPLVQGSVSPGLGGRRGDDRIGRGLRFARATVCLSVGTTGFVTMALSVVWLFAFQTLYGYVYQRIGWIVAVFMGGLVVGCWLAGRRVGRNGTGVTNYRSRLIAVDLALVGLSASVPAVLPALAALQSNPTTFALVESCIVAMVALTGILGGATFALAGGIQYELSGHRGTAAGRVVGADHAGACLGALVGGVLLVPVFGIVVCAVFLAALKTVSAAWLILAPTPPNQNPRSHGDG